MEKKTAFNEIHRAAGAKMVSFAGYDMPVVYTTINEEHIAVRERAGLFDVSHMGQFIVKGRQAYDLVQKISTNDASVLKPGDAQYSCLPNADGGVIDDLIVYRLFEDQCSDGEQAYMLVVNAANIEKDWEWINAANTFDTRLINISEQTSLLALQGPKATEILTKLTETNLEEIEYYTFRKGTVAGVDNVIISATGYTGSGGFELYFDIAQSEAIWNAIIEAGAEYDMALAGLGSRDTLRLEKGYCLYGHELDMDTSPIEAGLGWIVKTKKEEDFFSKTIFKQQRKKGGKVQKLIAFTLEDRRIPRQGYPIVTELGEEVGRVTSGTMSPCLEKPIGMGFVKTDILDAGKTLCVQMRKKQQPLTLVKLPFV